VADKGAASGVCGEAGDGAWFELGVSLGCMAGLIVWLELCRGTVSSLGRGMFGIVGAWCLQLWLRSVRALSMLHAQQYKVLRAQSYDEGRASLGRCAFV
jgi:hypothetical protein